MAGKGNHRLNLECEKLAIDREGYPECIPLMGMVNLLAGTDDKSSSDWQVWASMVWRKVVPGQRWVGDDPKQADSNVQVVELLITPIGQVEAAHWLRSMGETADTLSDHAKHWLGDCLGKPVTPRQHRQHRLDKLRQVIQLLKAADPDLDTHAMPGTRANLLELCQKLHPGAFQIEEKTFKADLPGICSFPSAGAKSSDYYQIALSLLS